MFSHVASPFSQHVSPFSLHASPFSRLLTSLTCVLLLTCVQAGAIDSDDKKNPVGSTVRGSSGVDAAPGLLSASPPAQTDSPFESSMPEERSLTDAAKAERKKEKELSELSKIKKSVKISNAPCLTWLPSTDTPRAVVLCVHGLGLHNGTYADFGQRMAKLGYAVYAIDVRGFGSFMEAKGRETVDFDGCLKDIQSTLKVLHRAHKGVPVFLLGESMGGAIALRATAIYPDLVDGLISSVPANDRFKQNHTRLSVAIHLLENPDKPFDVGKDIISQATKKQELRDQWSKDPLNKLNLSPKELLQFQHFMNQNHKCAKLIQVTPVLFVQGCNDMLVKPKGTVELFNELATRDRQLDLIANAEHLIFEENQCTDEGINKVSSWLDAHLNTHGKEDRADSAKTSNTHPKTSQLEPTKNDLQTLER
ncbi:MAG TPA: alpha/beta fold hydrolase [Drouetiella sp.]|jgi:acylglycerol lipase